MIPKDPATIEDRNCATGDPEAFFPSAVDVRGVAAAKRICAGCPALDVCLEWAMHHERGTGHSSRTGVYGGLSARQRANLAAQQRRIDPASGRKPIDHGTEAGHTAHRRADEEPCAACKRAATAAKRAREERAA